MNIIKTVFRKQFESLESQISELEKENKRLMDRKTSMEIEAIEKAGKFHSLESDNTVLKKELDQVKKENEIMKKYYKLDEEPSDEIKTKIHIDLEINRLKEEKIQIQMQALMSSIPRQNPICYPVYYPTIGKRW